jgi:hypothetical protein
MASDTSRNEFDISMFIIKFAFHFNGVYFESLNQHEKVLSYSEAEGFSRCLMNFVVKGGNKRYVKGLDVRGGNCKFTEANQYTKHLNI